MVQNTQIYKFFGIICLTFMIGIASTNEIRILESLLKEKNSNTLSKCVEPIEYIVNIDFDERFDYFIINSAALINVSCELPQITVYYGNYNCKVQGNKFPISGTFSYLIGEQSYSMKESDLADMTITKKTEKNLNIREDILPGNYWINTTSICTSKSFAQIFTYENNSKEKKLILPRIPAKWIFPYWINPQKKAKFTIAVEHPKTYLVRSHTSFEFSTFENHIKNTKTLFSTTPNVMSTHMAAVVIMPAEFRQAGFFLVWCEKNSSHMSELLALNDTQYARSIIRTLIYNIRIPCSGDTHYIVFPVACENIVTAGLVLFKAYDIAFNEEVDSLIKRKEATCLIARNTIQEIFSDWLAIYRQSDPWFIMGFSTVYGTLVIDEIYNTTFADLYLVQTRRKFLTDTETMLKYPLPNSQDFMENYFIELWTQKAFSIFHMWNILFKSEKVFYKSLFTKAVHVYNQRSNNQSQFDDVWTALEADDTLLKSMHIPINIKTIIKSWTNHEGFPVIKVTRNYKTGSVTIMVTDCIVNSDEKLCDRKWWIPVTFILYNHENNSIELYQKFLQPNGQNITISNIHNNNCIMLVGLTGCRVNYDRKNWMSIADFLKTITLTSSRTFTIARSQLLDDALYFMIQNPDTNPALSDNSDLKMFLNLASYLSQETDSYEAWYPMLIAMEHMSKMFLYTGSFDLKVDLMEILSNFPKPKLFTKYSENSVSNNLRHEIIKWTCIVGSMDCHNHINHMLEWHLQNPAENKFLPNWRKWIYCQGLLLENLHYDKSMLWQTIVNMYKTQLNDTTELLELLTCSRHDSNVIESMNVLGSKDRCKNKFGILETQNNARAIAFLNLLAKHSNYYAPLKIILSKLLTTKPKEITILLTMSTIINNIYSEERLDEVHEFLTHKLILQQHFFFIQLENKINNRRTAIKKMQDDIQNKPSHVLSSNQ